MKNTILILISLLFLTGCITVDGLHTEWYDNGQKKVEVNFKDGEEEGLITFWDKNGQKAFEINYHDDKQDELWVEWYENGQRAREENYQ